MPTSEVPDIMTMSLLLGVVISLACNDEILA